MKVLQINCVYGEGSTGRITRVIQEGLVTSGADGVVICGRRGPKEDSKIYSMISEGRGKLNKLWSMITGVPFGGCFITTQRIKKIIRREQPDVVHLQCINGHFCNIFRLLEFLKASGIPTVLTLHAEFMYTASCSHAGPCDQFITGCKQCPVRKSGLHSLVFDRTSHSWQRMHRIYKDWDQLKVVACSDWIAGRAGKSGEMGKRDIRVLRNGIDNTSVFYPREKARQMILEKYSLPQDKKLVLFVSPGFSSLKGFDLLLELAEKCKDDPMHFVLVGGAYEGREPNLTSLGKIADANLLAQMYSAADALVICSRNDTYPTVCLEANSCGTGVVGFDVGGVKETICPGMGTVVPFGDTDAMRKALLEWSEQKPSGETVEKARTRHSQQRMVREYLQLYQELIR